MRFFPLLLACALWLPLAAAGDATHPRLLEAEQALAAGDATGAKIALNLLLEETRDAAQRRQAKRLMDTALPVAEASKHLQRGELFLVEPTLRAVERKLGRTPADAALHERIAQLRAETEALRTQLRREGIYTRFAVRRLLATEKIATGDYPLTRTEAERVLLPALAADGDKYRLLEWQPTLRGYRLVLQDTRSGESLEVTPD